MDEAKLSREKIGLRANQGYLVLRRSESGRNQPRSEKRPPYGQGFCFLIGRRGMEFSGEPLRGMGSVGDGSHRRSEVIAFYEDHHISKKEDCKLEPSSFGVR